MITCQVPLPLLAPILLLLAIAALHRYRTRHARRALREARVLAVMRGGAKYLLDISRLSGVPAGSLYPLLADLERRYEVISLHEAPRPDGEPSRRVYFPITNREETPDVR